MKKVLLYPLFIFLFVSLACGFGGGDEEPPTTEPPAIPTVVELPPTEPPEIPTEMPPTEPPEVPTPIPTEQEASSEETEETDQTSAGSGEWSTWVAAGDKTKQFANLSGNLLKIKLPSAETYAYAEIIDANYTDVYVEAEVETLNGGTNGLAVLCRSSEDGWYEVRIHTIGSKDYSAGSFQVYRYDSSLLDQKKNPYVNLLPDLIKLNSVDIINGYKVNKVGLLCEGNQFKVFINGKVQMLKGEELVMTDNAFPAGSVGVGAMSFGEGSVEIIVNTDQFLVSQP